MTIKDMLSWPKENGLWKFTILEFVNSFLESLAIDRNFVIK